MDVNATLAEVRAILSRGRFEDLTPTDSHRLVELAEALDTWLAGGGFMPARWLTISRLPANVEHDARWWLVRPSELAARYGFDADKLRDDINPEDLNDRQFDLVMAAVRLCEERMSGTTVPEE
jgi:hypothetical protein